MQAIIMAILTFFLFEPIENKLNLYMKEINLPADSARQVLSCFKSETPEIVEKVQSDLGWTTTTLLSVWTGTANVEQIIRDAAPACAEPFDKQKGGAEI